MSMSMSGPAMAGAVAAFREKTPEERARIEEYHAAVAAAVPVPGGVHVERPIDARLAEMEVDRLLYTVTTIAASKRYGGTRTVAIFDTFEEAQGVVLRNVGDIWEYSYHLAVIEGVISNCLYGGFSERPQYWYRWDESEYSRACRAARRAGQEEPERPDVPDGMPNNWEDGHYVAIDAPPGYEHTFGFGIG